MAKLVERGSQWRVLRIGAMIARPKSASPVLMKQAMSNVSLSNLLHISMFIGEQCSGVFVEEKENDPSSFQIPTIGAEASSPIEENGLSPNGLPIAIQRRLDEQSANRSG